MGVFIINLLRLIFSLRFIGGATLAWQLLAHREEVTTAAGSIVGAAGEAAETAERASSGIGLLLVAGLVAVALASGRR